MKTWLSAVMFLLVLLVVCTARAQDSLSLADVARQQRSEKKQESKLVLSDQEHDQPVAPDAADSSLCGTPLPIMQAVYVSALTGQKTPPEDQMAKELLGWLNAHPQLDKLDPEVLAKSDEPRTDIQEQADQDLADKIAQSFTDEMVEYKKNHTDEEVQQKLATLMSAKLPARQADVLESAIRDEKMRRQSASGTPTEKARVEEAVNLYAICENKRLISSQAEVEKMSKDSLKSKLEEAGFNLEPPPAPEEAKGN